MRPTIALMGVVLTGVAFVQTDAFAQKAQIITQVNAAAWGMGPDPKVTERIDKRCRGLTECKFRADPDIVGGIPPGEPTHQFGVKYECGIEAKVAKAYEHQEIKLSCP